MCPAWPHDDRRLPYRSPERAAGPCERHHQEGAAHRQAAPESDRVVAKALDRAARSAGTKQARQYARARAGLQGLLAQSEAADEKGTLGVPLALLVTAINALLGQIPA